jgi:hypothetical protein
MLYHHFYGPPAKVIMDEMSDNLTMLSPGTLRYSELHLHRLLGAYLQAFQVWCDRIDAFCDPPFPWQNPTPYQRRAYYRQKGWRRSVDWAQQNMDIAYGRYLKAVKRLSPEEDAFWRKYLVGWRARHGRNLPHEPVKPSGSGAIASYWHPEVIVTHLFPKPVPKNARERRQVRIANKRVARTVTR